MCAHLFSANCGRVLEAREDVEEVKVLLALLFADQACATALEYSSFGELTWNGASSAGANQEMQRCRVGQQELGFPSGCRDEPAFALPAGRKRCQDRPAAGGNRPQQLAGEALLHVWCEGLTRRLDRTSSMQAMANSPPRRGVRSG